MNISICGDFPALPAKKIEILGFAAALAGGGGGGGDQGGSGGSGKTQNLNFSGREPNGAGGSETVPP